MSLHTKSRSFTIAIAALTAVAGRVSAGPLTPPVGPVAATMKTLSDVEPRTEMNAANTPGDADSMLRITAPGSYYLTSSITALPGKRGIEIAADDVTIDLNGFRIGGYAGALQGIKCVGTARRNVTIRNGSIWTMSGGGIDFRGDGVESTKGCRVERVTIQDCGAHGVFGADECLFDHVIASGNAAAGIFVQGSGDLHDCVVNRNADFGIWISRGTVRDCSANSNTGNGIYGIAAVISNSLAKANTSFGISVGRGAITNCTSTENLEGGIQGAGECLLQGNTCVDNSNAGGTATGISCSNSSGRSRVEGNTCLNNDVGIKATTTKNVIIRNTCSGNLTNWSIVAGNFYGPIIDRTGVTPVAANGNSAAGVLGSSDPNANFSY